MKIIKSNLVAINTKTFSMKGRFISSFAVFLPFGLTSSQPRSEQDLYAALSACLEMGIDSCVKKQHPEFLVNGVFHSRQRKGVTGGEVSVAVGDISKQLYVFGDRYWQMNGLPGNPSEITEMPIVLANAFGGSNDAHNPLGKGLEKDSDGIQWLPNIEDPRHLLTSSSAVSRPVTFGPLRVLDSPRKDMLGPVAEEDDPYSIPARIDWLYFNDAPSDQWFKQPLTGNERYRFGNLHPELPIIEGALPNWRARVFVKRKSGDQDETVEEIPLVLDTLWFAPHKELGALVFHGSTEVSDRYGSDVSHLLAAFEDTTDRSRDISWYRSAIENRDDDEQSLKYMLYQRDIVPVSVDLDDMDDSIGPDDIQGFMGDNLDERFKQLDEQINALVSKELQGPIDQITAKIHELETQNAGPDIIDPLLKRKKELEALRDETDADDLNDPELVYLLGLIDLALPKSRKDPDVIDPMGIDLKKMDEFWVGMDEYINGKIKETLPVAENAISDAKSKLKDSGSDTDTISKVSDDLDDAERYIQSIAEENEELAPLVRPSNGKELAEVEASLKESFSQSMSAFKTDVRNDEENAGDALPADVSELQIQHEEILNDIRQERLELQDLAVEMKSTYLMGAHLMDEGLSPHDMPLSDLKRKFQQAYQNNELHGHDWACLEFTNEHWDGVDLGDCYLEQTRFNDCRFTDVLFDEAILARARFTSCLFDQCSFSETNLGAIFSDDNEFIACEFPNAILSNSAFSRTRFFKCNIDNCQTMDLVLKHTVFHECRVVDLNFLEAELPECRFVHSHLKGVNFLEINASQFVMSGCDIDTLSFIDCNIPESDFSDSRVNGLNFSGDNTLENSDFSAMQGAGLCVGNANLEASCFNNVQLQNAYFGNANLGNSQMKSADLSRANFMSARMDGADFRGSNLFEANLGNTSLVGADFRHTNCFSANFLDATLGETRFAGADLTNTLIEEWRP